MIGCQHDLEDTVQSIRTDTATFLQCMNSLRTKSTSGFHASAEHKGRTYAVLEVLVDWSRRAYYRASDGGQDEECINKLHVDVETRLYLDARVAECEDTTKLFVVSLHTEER